MPNDATVLLKNNKTGGLEKRPLATYKADIASGLYDQTQDSVVRTNRLGATVANSPAEAQVSVAGGEQVQSGAAEAEAAATTRQRAAFDTGGMKVAAFASGLLNAASVGLYNPHGDIDIANDVNSGSNFAGNLVGTLMPLPGGVLNAGRSAGAALAKQALGDLTKSAGKRILARGAEEAAAGAALMGAQGLGNQVSDVVFDDKPFVASAILHDIKLGALLGGGFGALGGSASEYLGLRRAARGEVAAQGGLLDPKSLDSQNLHAQMGDAIGHLDDVVSQHEMKLGVMEVVGKESGLVPKRFMGENQRLAANARVAGERLRKMDMEGALAGDDLKATAAWRDVMEEYQAKVVKLDENMAAQPWEKPANIGKPKFGPQQGPGVYRDATQIGLANNLEEGVASEMSVGLHARMQEPGMSEAYEKQMGRPYEAPGELQQLSPDIRNLGGEVTPTSELKTGMAKTPRPEPVSVESGAQSPIQSQLPTAERSTAALSAQPEVAPEAGLKPEPTPKSFEELNQFADKLKGEPANPQGLKPEYDQLRAAGRDNAKQAVRDYIDKWYQESAASGPRPLKPTPADVAASKISGIMDEIRQATGSRLDSAAAVDIFKAEGVKPAVTSLGGMVDQIVAARRIARAVADESRGLASPLRASARERILGVTGKHIGRKLTTMLAGGMVGGPAGAILGYAFADKLFGTAGRAAGSAGRLQQAIAKTVDSLTSNSKATRVASAAVSTFINKPVAYSDAGPIKDPLERIQEIQRVAANPDVLQNYIKQQMGDFAHLHPDIADQVAQKGAQQVIQLSIRAPRIAWDNLGDPIQPAAQAMRRWLSFENATHDILGSLHSIQNNTANEQQMDAIKVQHPEVHQRLVQGLLSDHEALKNASRATKKTASDLVGVSFSVSGDPAFVARQQAAWSVHAAGQNPSGGGPTPPAQTPADASAKAPGN